MVEAKIINTANGRNGPSCDIGLKPETGHSLHDPKAALPYRRYRWVPPRSWPGGRYEGDRHRDDEAAAQPHLRIDPGDDCSPQKMGSEINAVTHSMD